MPKRIIRNARESVRRSYEVEYIPEGEHKPSPLDLIIQKLLNNRGKSFVLLEKSHRKASSANGLVRRLRRRAEKGGVGDIVYITARSFWADGLVRVFGRSLTNEEYREALNKAAHPKKEQHHERDDHGSDDHDGPGGGEGEG